MSYCSSGCYCPDYYKIIGMDETYYIIFKEVIGIISGVLSGITLMPQIYIAIQTKGKETMNYSFLGITLLATIFWFIYGALLGSIQTIVLEIVVFTNVLILFICKLVYSVNQHKIKQKSQTLSIENQ